MSETNEAGEPLVLIERHEAWGELVLNRPEKRNALSGPLVEQLHAGLTDLINDASVNVILIRGAGGTFCAGRDRDAFAQSPQLAWVATFGDTTRRFHQAVYNCPKPVIGALERAAIAAGSALALACDYLIAGETARFHVAEVNMGLAAPLNVAWLHLKYGAATALEFAAAGQPCAGRRLYERGLAVAAVPDERVVEEARVYATALAANKPAAVATVKQCIRALNGPEAFAAAVETVQAAIRAMR